MPQQLSSPFNPVRAKSGFLYNLFSCSSYVRSCELENYNSKSMIHINSSLRSTEPVHAPLKQASSAVMMIHFGHSWNVFLLYQRSWNVMELWFLEQIMWLFSYTCVDNIWSHWRNLVSRPGCWKEWVWLRCCSCNTGDIIMLAGWSSKTVSPSPPLPSVFHLCFQFHLMRGGAGYKKRQMIFGVVTFLFATWELFAVSNRTPRFFHAEILSLVDYDFEGLHLCF